MTIFDAMVVIAEAEITRRREKVREYDKKWKLANRDKVNAATKRWREAHKDKVAEWGRLWRLANREKVREAKRRYAKSHPEVMRKLARRYYLRHTEAIKKLRKRHIEKFIASHTDTWAERYIRHVEAVERNIDALANETWWLQYDGRPITIAPDFRKYKSGNSAADRSECPADCACRFPRMARRWWARVAHSKRGVIDGD